MKLVLELSAALAALLTLIDSTRPDDGLAGELEQLSERVSRMLATMEIARIGGRGYTPEFGRLSVFQQPLSTMYSTAVQLPERFVTYVRFTPYEFEKLLFSGPTSWRWFAT